MKKLFTREDVLERSRLADKARMDALKKSDGACIQTPPATNRKRRKNKQKKKKK